MSLLQTLFDAPAPGGYGGPKKWMFDNYGQADAACTSQDTCDSGCPNPVTYPISVVLTPMPHKCSCPICEPCATNKPCPTCAPCPPSPPEENKQCYGFFESTKISKYWNRKDKMRNDDDNDDDDEICSSNSFKSNQKNDGKIKLASEKGMLKTNSRYQHLTAVCVCVGAETQTCNPTSALQGTAVQ